MTDVLGPARWRDEPRRGTPLSQERVRIREGRHGEGRYSERQAFDGLVDTLYYWRFRTDEVEAWAQRYVDAAASGDHEARQEAFQALEAFSDACNRERLGSDVVDRLSEPDPMPNLFASVSGKGPYQRYSYRIERDDYPIINAWKAEIEALAESITKVLDGELGNEEKRQRYRALLGTQPDDSHVLRFALALFLMQQKSSWQRFMTPFRGLILAVAGGIRSVRDFGKRLDLCADLALVGQIMADELGFYAQVRNTTAHPDAPIRKGFHQYLVFEDGVVIDVGADPSVAGFFPDLETYRAVLGVNADEIFFC